jgi:uncharacterized protein YceK
MGKTGRMVLLLVIATFTGCGTYANLHPQSWLVAGDFPEWHEGEKPEAFGGIRRDLKAMPLGLLDLPFSFVGDLLTLHTIPESQP